jgi:hypothetical protein
MNGLACCLITMMICLKRKKMRKELRASLENAWTRVVELET